MYMDAKQQPLIVNFFGGPGAGKTAAAWEVAAALKKVGYVCEYVSEFAKELVWDKKFDLLADQRYVSDNQYQRLNRLRGSGVEVVVTDSPILLGKIYGEGKIDKAYDEQISRYYDSFENFNLVVKRGDRYETAGRLETPAEAQEIDRKIINLLRSNDIFYGNYHHNEIDKTVDRINTTFERLYGVHHDSLAVAQDKMHGAGGAMSVSKFLKLTQEDAKQISAAIKNGAMYSE